MILDCDESGTLLSLVRKFLSNFGKILTGWNLATSDNQFAIELPDDVPQRSVQPELAVHAAPFSWADQMLVGILNRVQFPIKFPFPEIQEAP